MTNDDKQEALDDLMHIAGQLNSLFQAFNRTGNQVVADELNFMRCCIVNAVKVIEESDRAALHEAAQQCNKFAGEVLSALVNRKDNNEL